MKHRGTEGTESSLELSLWSLCLCVSIPHILTFVHGLKGATHQWHFTGRPSPGALHGCQYPTMLHLVKLLPGCKQHDRGSEPSRYLATFTNIPISALSAAPRETLFAARRETPPRDASHKLKFGGWYFQTNNGGRPAMRRASATCP